MVRTSGLVNPQALYRSGLYRGGERVGLSIQWRSAAGTSSSVDSNEFLIEHGVLKYIVIYPDREVSLQSLLQRYGPPDKLHVMVTGRHVPALRVTLFYPIRGFTATVELPADELVLRPETNVIQVWYSDAGPLETFIEQGISYLGSYLGTTPEQWSQSLRDWPGYGVIEVP